MSFYCYDIIIIDVYNKIEIYLRGGYDMGKLKDVLSIFFIILLFVVYIFYRDNVMAVCIVAAVLWIDLIITILNKKTLPKPDYYIHRTIIANISKCSIAILAIILAIINIRLMITKGFYEEFDGFIIIIIPLILLNFLNDDRRVYFYDNGLVYHGEALEFININSFEWKKERKYEIILHYNDEEYDIKVSEDKVEYVDKILRENIL